MAHQTRQVRTSIYASDDVAVTEAGLPPRDEISRYFLMDESALVGGLTERAVYSEDQRRRTAAIGRHLVEYSRTVSSKSESGIDAFMREYGLTTDEGVILLCLAEALLRIPDQETADAFLADKLTGGNWRRHLGASDSLFVNASTWGLMLSGRVLKLRHGIDEDPPATIARLVARSGEAMVSRAVRKAVALLSEQFVLGRDIEAAITRGKSFEAQGYRLSYDMLGEEALSDRHGAEYFARYMTAVEAVGEAAGPFALPFADALMARPSISIKLSALHAKFLPGCEQQLHEELKPRLVELAKAAMAFGLPLTFDAEEQDRLDVTLEMFASVFTDPAFAHWNGLGLAVQAYSKRSIPVLRWLRKLALQYGKRIPVRLVKGAYWDFEIKAAQEQGLADYPVFTRKLHTDVSYLACMRFLFENGTLFYPQIATHNALNIATALTAAGTAEFEFQRLHGMGDGVYKAVTAAKEGALPCRIYAPVGAHDVLLSYLVRRLLENGANTSFVNRLSHSELSLAEMVEDPVERLERERASQTAVKALVKPRDVYWPDRKNSSGESYADPVVRDHVMSGITAELDTQFEIGPLCAAESKADVDREQILLCPHDRTERLGTVHLSGVADLQAVSNVAVKAGPEWDRLGGIERGKLLQLTADLYERDRIKLMALLVRESGQTIAAAQTEVRRAIDYLRTYAMQTREQFTEPVQLRATTGETNRQKLRGIGPYLAISPFSAPLAVFTGQVSAALGAGNPVIAKPAPQTPLIAFHAVKLFHEAGVPAGVLQLITGGDRIAAMACKDRNIQGIVATGHTNTIWAIRKVLAERRDMNVPLIAAGSTFNGVIADSSALAECVVRDVMQSAFYNAGQSCAAARVLFVQQDSAGKIIELLKAAIDDLRVADPLSFATDIGPVIDHRAQDMIDAHKLAMKHKGTELIDCALDLDLRAGSYVAPALYELSRLDGVSDEVFGPILHVVRYQRGHLKSVIEQLMKSGMCRSISVHSRIDAVADYVENLASAGNLFVNRPEIDTVPGAQPSGGGAISLAARQSGGPGYVASFARTTTRTDNITATGGNIRLLTHGLSKAD